MKTWRTLEVVDLAGPKFQLRDRRAKLACAGRSPGAAGRSACATWRCKGFDIGDGPARSARDEACATIERMPQ